MLSTQPGQIIVIGAMAENGTIGSGQGMPWNVPEEYQHFVDTVHGQAVIIGRRSYDIFGADFHAETFVISRSAVIEGVTVCRGLPAAIELASRLNRAIFIAGGRSIYEQGIPRANRMLLSTIHGEYEGDTYFPTFDRTKWRLEQEFDHANYRLRDWRRIENEPLSS